MFTSNNTDGTQADYDDADNDGSKDSEEYEKIFSGEELAAGEYHVSVAGDSYYQMTAKNFSILKAIEKNAELIATKTDPKETDGESQYDNIKLIANTLTDAKKLSFRGADAGEFLTCVLGDIILAKGNAETFEDTYTVLRKSLENQRLSISGVDTDEEALSLVHYQDSYTLASKMISTFAEIYDRLILETGV